MRSAHEGQGSGHESDVEEQDAQLTRAKKSKPAEEQAVEGAESDVDMFMVSFPLNILLSFLNAINAFLSRFLIHL